MITRFSDLSKIRAVLLQEMVEVPSSIMALVVSVILLVIYNLKLVLVASVNIPLQLADLLILSSRLRQISREELRKSTEVSSFVLVGIESLPALRLARGEA